MIPEEARPFVGRIDPPIVRRVEKGAIRRYAEAVGNDNPLYHDEEHARRSRFGGIIAPPGFFGWPIEPASASTGLPDIVVELQAALGKAGFPRILDGGITYDFRLPVRAGDILIATPRISDIAEKQGKSGAMMMCLFEMTYSNQHGDLVARSVQTFFAR